MTGRDAMLLAGGLLAGALVVAVVAVRPLGKTFFGDTETEIVLRNEGSGCVLTGKATEVQVGKNKKLTWKIKNHCDSQPTVTVGNFRTAATGAQSNCSSATEGGATWPFQQDEEVDRRRATAGPGSEEEPNDEGEIQLKVKPRNVLGETQLRYYYDICLGEAKADPRLIIER